MGTIVLFRLQLPNFLLDVVISAGHLLGRCFRIVQNLLCCMHGRVQRLDGISRIVAQVHPFHLCDQVVQRIPSGILRRSLIAWVSAKAASSTASCVTSPEPCSRMASAAASASWKASCPSGLVHMEGIRIIDQGLQATQVCPEDQLIQGVFQSLIRFLDVRFQSVSTLCIDILCALVRFFKAFVAAFGKELGVNLGCNLQELSEGIHIALFKFEILNRFDQAFPRLIDLRLRRRIILIYLLCRSPRLQEILPLLYPQGRPTLLP